MKDNISQNFSQKEEIGIISIEHYSPRNYINQSDLETYMGVSKGKFTIGLGQKQMRFCTENEEVHSMAMTSLRRLLERNKSSLLKLGRLEYATETLLDKSKSTKTLLLDVLKEILGDPNSEQFDELEGVTNLNACYGGTAAVINSVNWVREQLASK